MGGGCLWTLSLIITRNKRGIPSGSASPLARILGKRRFRIQGDSIHGQSEAREGNFLYALWRRAAKLRRNATCVARNSLRIGSSFEQRQYFVCSWVRRRRDRRTHSDISQQTFQRDHAKVHESLSIIWSNQNFIQFQ